MLSNRYVFKSNRLKDEYINGSIDYQAYSSSLEEIKKEELSSVVFDHNLRLIEEEMFSLESKQLDEANQEISIRKKNAESLKLQIELEKTKQLEEQRRLKEEERKMQPQSLEEQLLKERTRFYKEEAPNIIEKYKNDSRKYRRRYDKLQLIIILGSALSTSTTGATIFTGTTNISITLKIIAAIFSLAVTISSGSIAYFKYKERGNDIQETADKIEDDYNALKLGTGIYKGQPLADALSTFAENTNNAISEHKKKQLLLDQPPDAKTAQAAQ